MKFKGFMITAVLGCSMLFCGGAKVCALESNEAEQIQENESQLSQWFDSEMWFYISQFGTAFFATVFALSSFIKSFKNVTSAFTKDTKEKEKLAAQITEDKEKILKANEHTVSMIKENNEATQKAIFEDNAKTREEIEKLIKVFGIAFSNDSKLVKNGAASEIMKVLGEENENAEA